MSRSCIVDDVITSTSVFGDGHISTHADPTYAQRGRRYLLVRSGASGEASGGAQFPKMGNSRPRTPMNHRAKFDAARQRNRATTQKQTNGNRYIHTLPIGMSPSPFILCG